METLTVGDLKKLLEFVPDDTPIYHERIEDVYFNEHKWESEKLESIIFEGALNNEKDEFIEVIGVKYDESEKALKLTAHF